MALQGEELRMMARAVETIKEEQRYLVGTKEAVDFIYLKCIAVADAHQLSKQGLRASTDLAYWLRHTHGEVFARTGKLLDIHLSEEEVCQEMDSFIEGYHPRLQRLRADPSYTAIDRIFGPLLDRTLPMTEAAIALTSFRASFDALSSKTRTSSYDLAETAGLELRTADDPRDAFARWYRSALEVPSTIEAACFDFMRAYQRMVEERTEAREDNQRHLLNLYLTKFPYETLDEMEAHLTQQACLLEDLARFSDDKQMRQGEATFHFLRAQMARHRRWLEMRLLSDE